MLTLSIVLFAVAAIGGVTLGVMHIQKNQAPLFLAVLHGIIGGAALVLFIIVTAQANLGNLAIVSIVIFVLAALGGLVLFVKHAGNRPLPRPLIYLHGLAAALAFVLVLIVAI